MISLPRITLTMLILIIVFPSFSHAACSNNDDGEPGRLGEIEFFSSDKMLRYCDGAQWVDMIENFCPSTITSCGETPSQRVVFATSGINAADSIGGVPGADALCQTAATNAGLKGTYFAWLTGDDTAEAPANRFEKSTVPYVLPTGTPIASDWSDLIDGTLTNPIDVDENGVIISSGETRVWTNTTTAGAQHSSNHCSDFSSILGTSLAGEIQYSDVRWSEADTTRNCGNQTRLYCFEQQGLIGHWKLDETSGTIAADSSGNGYDATFYSENASLMTVPGVIGTGLDFDLDDRRLETGSNTTFANLDDITVAFWAKTSKTNVQGMVDIVGVLTVSYRNDGYDFSVSAPAWDGGGLQKNSSGDVLPVDTWVHFAVTYSYNDPVGTNPKMYVNGQPVSVVNSSSPSGVYSPPASTSVMIGSYLYSGSYRELGGPMDDVRIYDRVLSASEIQDLYESTEASLVGHWKFDETNGSTVVDSSPNEFNASVSGFLLSDASVEGIVDRALNLNTEGFPYIKMEVASIGAHTNLSAMTVSGWIKLDEYNGNQIIVDVEDLARLYVGFNTDRLTFEAFAWDGSNGQWNIPGLPLDEWVHVAVTYSYIDPVGTRPIFYINGVAYATPGVAIMPTGSFVSPAAGRTFLAARHDSSSLFYGSMDDLRIFNRVLSAGEIEIIVNCTRPGAQFYNFSDDVMQWCNGVNSAVNMHAPASGAGGCTSPNVVEGTLDFDTDRFKACDGNGWIDIGK